MFLNYFSRMDNWRIFKLSGIKRLTVLFSTLILSSSAFSFDFEADTRKLWDDLNAGDSVAFSSHYFPGAVLYSVKADGVQNVPISNFIRILTKFKNKEYREEITKVTVRELQNGLTYVDVHFNFYINEAFSFSGIDHVIWIEENSEYLIATHYTGALKPQFTEAKDGPPETKTLDELMNKWHNDVATYQFDAYFDFMASGFIFLGTDPTERWQKDEFRKFCQPYFEKKSTWDFKTNWRNWYMSEDGQTAWFEESLDTWMEECRGSGVLINENGQWKIAHYNLSALIENEKIDKFIKLRQK